MKRISDLRFRMFRVAFCLLLTAGGLLYFSACRIPNLESAECIESKEVVKKLYSYHIGNDMKFTQENLKQREEFLAAELIRDLVARPASPVDYFTQTDDYPKAFRIGKCEALSPDKTVFDVLLFWRTDTRSEEKNIRVETIKENGQWRVRQVSSPQ